VLDQVGSWYVARGDQQVGPLANDEFLRFVKQGELEADGQIWRPFRGLTQGRRCPWVAPTAQERKRSSPDTSEATFYTNF
jgi:hypothetical protein